MLLSLVPEIHGRLAAGVSATSAGQAPPTISIARPPDEQLAQRAQPAARRHVQVGERDARDDAKRDEHLRLKAQPDADAGQHEPARASVFERAHREPQRRDAAEDQQHVGVVVARDRDRDRRQRQRQPGDEAAEAAEAPPHEVVDQRDARDAHQRLRHEHAQRVVAEHANRQRLHPQVERRLVDASSRRSDRLRRTGSCASSSSSSARPRCSSRSPSRCDRAPRGRAAQRARSARSAPDAAGGRSARAAADARRRPRPAVEAPAGLAGEAAEEDCQEKLIGAGLRARVRAVCELAECCRSGRMRRRCAVHRHRERCAGCPGAPVQLHTAVHIRFAAIRRT